MAYGVLVVLYFNGSFRTCCQATFSAMFAILELGPVMAVMAYVIWTVKRRDSIKD
jgi:hypothetical protein